jgi:hypothetical protein
MVPGIEHQFHMICRIFLFNLKTCSCYIIEHNKHQNQHYQTSSLWYQQLKYQLGHIKTMTNMTGKLIDSEAKVGFYDQQTELEFSWNSVCILQ